MTEEHSDMTDQPTETSPNEETPSGEQSQAFETYQTIAETGGMLPSLRWKDNLIQALIIAAATGICALVGLVIWGPIGQPFEGVELEVSSCE
jgi:hypothetical protein